MPLEGMKLSVGLGLNLTGFEALTQVAKELENLQQLAYKTEERFREMGMAARGGSARSASPGIASAQNGLGREFDIRERHANRLAVMEETLARRKSSAWDRLGDMVMGGIGISAAFEATKMAREAISAAGNLDQRQAALRSSGYSEAQIKNLTSQAVGQFIPGFNATEKLFLGQEIGTTVGRENATPELIKALATTAQSVQTITGSTDMQGTLRSVTRGANEMGTVDPHTGKLSGDVEAQNAIAFQHMIAMTGGLTTADQMQHTLQMAQAPLRTMDLAHNTHLQAQIAVASESLKDDTGAALSNTLNSLQSGKMLNSGKTRAVLGQMGLLNFPAVDLGLDPENKGGEMKFINTQTMLRGYKGSDPLAFLGQIYQGARGIAQRDDQRIGKKESPEEFEGHVQGIVKAAVGDANIARFASSIFSKTGQEEVKKDEEAALTMPKTIAEMAEKSMNLNLAFQSVTASFEEMSSVLLTSGGFAKDLAGALVGVAKVMNMISNFALNNKGLMEVITRIAEAAAALAALRLGRGMLGMAGRAMGTGGLVGAAEEVAGKAMMPVAIMEVGTLIIKGGLGGLAGNAAKAEAGLAEGAVVGAATKGKTGIMSQMLDPEFAVGGALATGKAAALKMAGRGLTAMIVGGIADSVVDGLTSEGSNVNAILKDSIEGAEIGSTFAGIPGAIVGAVLDPVVRGVSKVATGGLTKSMEQQQDYAKEHPKEEYVDPISGIGVHGLKNSDVVAPGFGIDSTIAHMNAEYANQNTAGGQPAVTAAKHRVGHALHAGTTGTPIPLPGGINPSAGAQSAYNEYLQHPGSTIISPTRSFGTALPSIGGTTTAPMAAGEKGISTQVPTITTNLIETSMLVVKGPGGSTTTGATPGDGTATGATGVGGGAGATTPDVGQKATGSVTSGTLIAGKPVTDQPLTQEQMGAIGLSTSMGNSYSPEIMAKYNAQKQGMAQDTALQSLAPGEPGLPTTATAAATQHDKLAAQWDRQTQRMNAMKEGHSAAGGHRMPTGAHGSAPIPPSAAGATGSLASTIGLSGKQYDAFRDSVAKIESGGKYDIMGGSSGRFAGKYQMGATEIAETAQHLGLPVPSQQQFLHDPAMQEKFFEQYTLDHNKTMMNDPKYAAMSPTQKASALAYAHNQGAGGAMKWIDTGAVGRDAFHTPGTAYSSAVTQAMAAVPQGLSSNAMGSVMTHTMAEMNAPNIQGPQPDQDQTQPPQTNQPISWHSHHYMDGEPIADVMMEKIIGNGPTAMSGASGFDSKGMPLSPGTSVARW